MKNGKGKIELKLAYELFKDTQQDNLEYVYRGKFNTDITDNILSLAEESLKLSEQKLSIKKRVYFVMVEGLQNITRHQEVLSVNFPVKPGLFVLQRKEHSYFITTGNLIEKRNIQILRKQIERVNSLTKDELNEFYKTHLAEGSFSGKGGAGLGLIEIARKSKGTLSYDFRKIRGKYYYFYLLTQIPISKDEQLEKNGVSEISLQNIKDLHDVLNREQITLNYSGLFNQENLVNLLGIIEKQMKGTAITRIKTFNVMTEMLQNLVQHAEMYNINKVVGKHGIFYITEQEDKFELTTGNYVANDKVLILKENIDYLNKLNLEELNDLYDKQLLKFDDDKNSLALGLGFIDMRLKCQGKLLYHFENIDNEFSFFILKITIPKKEKFVERYFLKGENDKPEIDFHPSEDIFKLSGKSIPENAIDYYRGAVHWLKEYIKSPNQNTVFEVNFTHLNTNTTHQLIKMFQLLSKISYNSNVSIKWFYSKDDEDMFDLGSRMKKLHDLDFTFIEY